MESFDNFAGDYKAILDKSLAIGGESSDYFIRYKAEYLKRLLGDDFSGTILDYGCGVGLLSLCLLEYFPKAKVHGFDVSVESIANVPDVLKKQGLFTSNTADLKQQYDAVVVANVLHHIEPPERQDVIKAIKGFLKPGATITIFEHNPINPLTRKVVRESPLDKGVILLPSKEPRGYLANAGFNDCKTNYIVFFPKPLSALRFTEPFLNWLPLGAQYALEGKA